MSELPKTQDERMWDALRDLVAAIPNIRFAVDPNKLRAVRAAKKILKETQHHAR